MSTHRLPGIVFSAEPPPAAEVLPRMDVAAFVGVASSGPLDVPVAVEEVGRFRDLFGDDPELAWDEERGAVERAFLGPSVAAFFRNGGRRCWVVRVAERERIHRHRFPLPGLSFRPRAGGAEELRGAEARARAAGSWAEELRAGTAVERRLLPLERAGDGEPFAASAGAYRVETAAPPGAVVPGDLLEVLFADGGPLLFLFVDRVEVRREGLRLEGAAGRWLAPVPVTSPPVTSPPPSPPEDPEAVGEVWLPVSEAEGLDLYAHQLAGSPPPRPPAIRRLRFELLAWRGEELTARIGGLGFHPHHPRFWGHLPADEELFALDEGRQLPITPASVAALEAEAADPRFPFAGPAEGGGAAWYLPIRELGGGLFAVMASRPDPALGRGPAEIPGSRLERDGLAGFGAGLFLDDDLARVGSGALLGAAEHKRYLRGEPLAGIHALLPVAEATLVAVPDAVHRGWSRGAPPLPELLGAPELEVVSGSEVGEGSTGDGDFLELRWSAVAGAREYRLEADADADADFPRPAVAYQGPATEASVPVPAGCPEARYFRVRARRGGEIGPWSNTVLRILPRPDFHACGDLPLLAPELDRTPLPGGGDRLSWNAVPGAGGYRVEAAEEPGFVTPRTVFEGPELTVELPPQLDGVGYLRVAAVRGPAGSVEVGPRSNTVVRLPVGRSRQVLRPASGEAPELLDVQRALLRFCAARGDLLALLALPRHFREEETRRHLAALAPMTGPSTAPTAPIEPSVFGAVPPLTAGEEPVMSYGALYHPWLAAVGEGRFPASPGFVPPEGAVAGTMAELAVARGAWWAPANRPLDGVVALDPSFDLDGWGRLAELGANLVRRDPRGFLALGADTLSRGEELRPIPVRRLMILIRRLAFREGARYVFEPHDDDFQALVQHRFERFLSDLHVRGAFAGRTAADAFRVVTDASVNPPRSIDAGRFVVELRVAPSRPLDFLTVRLVQTGPEQLSLQES